MIEQFIQILLRSRMKIIDYRRVLELKEAMLDVNQTWFTISVASPFTFMHAVE